MYGPLSWYLEMLKMDKDEAERLFWDMAFVTLVGWQFHPGSYRQTMTEEQFQDALDVVADCVDMMVAKRQLRRFPNGSHGGE